MKIKILASMALVAVAFACISAAPAQAYRVFYTPAVYNNPVYSGYYAPPVYFHHRHWWR
jgi:hypothetical protein